MKGKVVLITGASSGIGRSTAMGIAEEGARVVMLCRNKERGETAKKEITEKTGNKDVHLLIADLSSQKQIRDAVGEFKRRFDRLDILINNAGLIMNERKETEDGYEMQLAVNHLAVFLLTNLLLDYLVISAPSRIINVSSQVHKGAEIPFDDLQSKSNYHPVGVYSWTKLANILFTYELARRLEDTGVTVNTLHPGVIATNLLDDYMGNPGSFRRNISRMRYPGPDKGAVTSVYLAVSPEVEGITGKYFVDKKAEDSSFNSYDKGLAERLWKVSAELTGMEQIASKEEFMNNLKDTS